MEDAFNDGAPLAVAVDLTPLRPGGTNGGIKPALFTLLAEAGRLAGESLFFIYLTRGSTHAEVRRLARPGDLLLCVTPDDPPPELRGASEHSLPSPPPDLLARIGASLLYAPFGACTYAAEGVPAVALIADLLHRDYPHTLTPAQIAEREVFLQHTIQCARMIQSISRNGAERLMLHYAVPEERIFFTHLPVQARLDQEPRGPLEQSPAKPARPYFFYPANLWKHKNHETLLVAYHLYRQQAGEAAWDLALTFHEEEKRAEEIRTLIRSLGIQEHVRLPGYVSEAALGQLWRGAGALVFPSLHEGFGIPLIEAMHYGVPIISSPDFSLRELAGNAALFINPRKPESIAAGMAKVAGNPALRASLQSRGRERLRFFDLSLEAEKLIRAWQTCAASRHDFPRAALSLQPKAEVAVPTPASKALWTFEVHAAPVPPNLRCRCYLDDASFGSFDPQQSPVFQFACQPRGRVLRVMVEGPGGAARQPAVATVTAMDPTDPMCRCVPLYGSTPEESL